MNLSSSIISDIQAIGCDVKQNEPMKQHTSFKIGGAADLFISAYSRKQLSELIVYLKERGIPLMLVGNGSNMLVSDSGISGAVVRLEGEFCEVTCRGERISAGAGASLSALCTCALENSLTGLEFAWGIPGSVGGAAFMNAGAYGGELRDVALSVEYIDENGECGLLSCESCGFGYRESIFQHEKKYITAVTVELKKGSADEIKRLMDDILQRRKDKQPLEMPSAGSVFKRPVGYYAGGLVEQCGLKGCVVGGAMVSEKHAGFIVNAGSATCADVLALVEHIQKTVRDSTGVELECEIKAVGRK